jgi:hypothetical protein
MKSCVCFIKGEMRFPGLWLHFHICVAAVAVTIIQIINETENILSISGITRRRVACVKCDTRLRPPT